MNSKLDEEEESRYLKATRTRGGWMKSKLDEEEQSRRDT